MIHANSSPTSVPGESAGSQVGDFFFRSPRRAPRVLKPFISVSQQIALLKARGLTVRDESEAGDVLRRIGYFRFSGYAHSLKKSRQSVPSWKPGYRTDASFEHVVQLGEFDRSLRALMLDGLETIEIAVRAAVVTRLGSLDVEAHRRPDLFDRRFTRRPPGEASSLHDEWLRRFDDLVSKSKEEFVDHHRRHYAGRLPIWAAMEVLEFGLLSKLIRGLQFRDAKALSDCFGLEHPVVLQSWMHMFNIARNRAAHHARIWNRTTTKIPLLPPASVCPDLAFLHRDEHAKTRLFGTLSCMRWMIRCIAPDCHWHREIHRLASTFPRASGLSLRAAGFPADWSSLPLWRD